MLEQKLAVVQQCPEEVFQRLPPGDVGTRQQREADAPLVGRGVAGQRRQKQRVDGFGVGGAGLGEQRGASRVGADFLMHDLSADEVQRLGQIRLGVAFALAGHGAGRAAEGFEKRMFVFAVR